MIYASMLSGPLMGYLCVMSPSSSTLQNCDNNRQQLWVVNHVAINAILTHNKTMAHNDFLNRVELKMVCTN